MVEPRSGRVVALQANFCLVALDRSAAGCESRLLCTRRTRLGKSGQRIHVGDRVEVESLEGSGDRGVVTSVEPRANLLERPAVANVDRVVVVVALREPSLDPLQLTRFLITAEAACPHVLLLLSKADLLPDMEVEAWCDRVRAWGYPVEAFSTRTGQGLERVHSHLAGHGIAVLCGPSGVGKSSLLNALLPDLSLRTGAVSGRLQRGRHTTRHVELFPLSEGALVADTPGFNRPVLPADPGDLARAFPELRARLRKRRCRFANCRHQGDAGCAVGTDWDRYSLYRQCLADVLAVRGSDRRRDPAAGLRLKGDRIEPVLAEELRRGSRRLDRQRLEREMSDREVSPPDREG